MTAPPNKMTAIYPQRPGHLWATSDSPAMPHEKDSHSVVYLIRDHDADLDGTRYHYTTFVETPSTRSAASITHLQRLQLGLRILIGMGGCGLLFCAVTLNNVQNGANYIMKLTPCAELIMTAFAMWYLAKAASGRISPKLIAYQLLILVNDIITLPLYGFLGMLAKASQDPTSQTDLQWTSFDAALTSKLILALWIIALGLGSSHCISAVISLYLLLRVRVTSQRMPFVDSTGFERETPLMKKRKSTMSDVSLSPGLPSESSPLAHMSRSGGKDSTTATLSPEVFCGPWPGSVNATDLNPPAWLSKRTGPVTRKPYKLSTPPRKSAPDRAYRLSRSISNETVIHHQVEADIREPGKHFSSGLSSDLPYGTIMTSPIANASNIDGLTMVPTIPSKSSRRESSIRLIGKTPGSEDDFLPSKHDTSLTPEARRPTARTYDFVFPGKPNIPENLRYRADEVSPTSMLHSGTRPKRKSANTSQGRYSLFPRSSQSYGDNGSKCRKGVDWVTHPSLS